MRKVDVLGVQEEALEAPARLRLAIERKISVLPVPGDGMSDRGEVPANLVGAPGLDRALEQRAVTGLLKDPVASHRLLHVDAATLLRLGGLLMLGERNVD